MGPVCLLCQGRFKEPVRSCCQHKAIIIGVGQTQVHLQFYANCVNVHTLLLPR